MKGEERIRSVMRPGEALLWCGSPVLRRFLSTIIACVIFGAIPFSFGSVFLAFTIAGLVRDGLQQSDVWGNLFGVMIALLFMGLGVSCFLYPFKVSSRLRDVTYAITNERGIVLTSPKMFWNPVPARLTGASMTEFSPDQLRQYKKKWMDLGRTDIIILQEWRKSSRRGGEWWYFGFLGLEDPDEPERVIQKHFLEAVQSTGKLA